MKNNLIFLLVAIAAIVSCEKETMVSEDGTNQPIPISYNLTANHPEATRAVKTAWEKDDAVFVFFTGASAPKHLKMTFDGTNWTSAEYDGAALSPGALGLKNGDSGTMRAVFLPFGSDATVSAKGNNFIFSKFQYTYYLTANLEYTVTDNKVSGNFNMAIPEGYVQFFIVDASATNGGYSLATDAVIPTGVDYIDADGTVNEAAATAGDNMSGYAYGTDSEKGYLFSGKLDPSYDRRGYYFAKTKTSGRTRADYFVTGKTLSSLDAVKLPSNDNVYSDGNDGKWVPVGSGLYVDLRRSVDEYPITGCTWATCNIHQSVPEEVGDKYTFSDLDNLGAVPLRDPFSVLSNESIFTYTPMTVHGKKGFVISADKGFIFLPLTSDSSPFCEYWTKSATEEDNTAAYYFEYAAGPSVNYKPGNKTESYAVRLIR